LIFSFKLYIADKGTACWYWKIKTH